MTYYVLVTGSGESSRANIEALMEDHYYAKGAEGTLVLAYETQPTKPQVFAAQYAKEKNKDIMVFCQENASTVGIPGASQTTAPDPVAAAVDFLKGQDSVAYLLWAESDIHILSACISAGIPAVDLCDGLVPLEGSTAPQVTVQQVSTTPKASEPVLTASEPVSKALTVEDATAEFRALVKEHIKQLEELLKRLG